MEIVNILKDFIPKENILINEPMSEHTSFRLGGNAKYFVLPSCEDEVIATVNALKKAGENFVVIGNGSNLLVSDKGFDGTVICIGKNMSKITVQGEEIHAMAGALLSTIASVARAHSLAGFEFASGIPGSLGGAVVMNAGAYDGEMKNVVSKTTYLSADGTLKTVVGKEHGFSYRKSIFTKDDVVLRSVITLQKGDADKISEYTRELSARRREKQPLEYPSAGSTFKRPEGYFAAKLIDDASLRGYRVGGAMVSEKHAGFVINYDNAKSADVYQLIKDVQSIVYDKFGVSLEPEIKFIGEF